MSFNFIKNIAQDNTESTNLFWNTYLDSLIVNDPLHH